MSLATALQWPGPEGNMAFRGRLSLPKQHECPTASSGPCLVCLLSRKQLDGEVVSLHLVVHDLDEDV